MQSRVIFSEPLIVQGQYFRALLGGTKTCEGRKLQGKFSGLRSGMFIHLKNGETGESRLCKIIRVHMYQPRTRLNPLLNFLTQEGVSNVLPGVNSLERTVEIYLSFGTTLEEIRESGFQGIFLKPV